MKIPLRLHALLLGTLLGCARGLVPTPLPPAQPAGPRQVVILSDLHLGIGQVAKDRWDPWEDFRFADALQALLTQLDAAGKGQTDLILAGDLLELWQSRTVPCDSGAADVGCSEPEARQRLQTVIAAHGAELRALGRFADSGQNRVVVLPGNHDAALLFPGVASDLLGALAAQRGRAQVAGAGYWVSLDGLLYAEHGHQIPGDANLFPGWPAPFVERGGVKRLARPWGEQFVQAFFNQYEDRFPILDNISPEAQGLRYGMETLGPQGSLAVTGQFLSFLLHETTWRQYLTILDPAARLPIWDVAQARAQGGRLLVESVLVGDPLRAAAEAAQAGGLLDATVRVLGDPQIAQICDVRWAARLVQVSAGQTPTLTLCPGGAAGARTVAQVLTQDRDERLSQRLAAVRKVLQERGLTTPLQVYLYGHTHEAMAPFHPMAGGAWDPVAVNSGAYQRVANAAWVEQARRARGLQPGEVLLRLTLEDLPACYPYLVIAPYSGTPRPELRRFGAGCPAGE